MRKLIAAMKISVDAKAAGPDGTADWVEAWSDDYGLLQDVDACLLGGGMYPGYEQYWTAIRNEPEKPIWITGQPPTSDERAYARFAERTAHHVLSSTVRSATWPMTRFITTLDDVVTLKQQPGKGIYLVGGARTTDSLIDAGLVDELRLIVYPLIAGAGKTLCAATERRRRLELNQLRQLSGGRVSLIYRVG